MDYPKTLTPSDWDKKKGLIAKTHPTGIGDALKALEKMHKAVDWDRYQPAAWAKTAPNMQAFDLLLAERLREVQAKVLPLAGQAEGVETLAKKWAGKFAKEKLIPKSTTQAAEGVESAAGDYAGAIKKYAQQLQTAAKSERDKLPAMSDEGEEAENKLFDPKVLASALQRLKRDIKLSAEFGFTPQTKDQPPVLLISFRINAKLLLNKIKTEKKISGSVGAYGEARCDKDGNLLLIADKTASGIVKGARAATKTAGVKFKSILLVDGKGTQLESDDEPQDDEQDTPQTETGKDEKSQLLELKSALEKLTGKLDGILKTAGTQRRSALLEAVKQIQEAVKKPDVVLAKRLLGELAKLIEAKDETPEVKPTPSKPQDPASAYVTLRKQISGDIKAALLLTAHSQRIKSLFEQAEGQLKTDQAAQALRTLTTLQEALETIARQKSDCEKVAVTVLQAVDEALKTVSTKNQERLKRARQAAQVLMQAGDYEKAQAALVEAGKLVVAIRKESTPSGGVGDDEGEEAGTFMQDMNDEADWNRQSGLLADVRAKLGDLQTWADPEHAALAKALQAVDSAASTRKFEQAGELLAALAPKVRKLHGEHPLRGQWLGLKQRIDAAAKKLDDLQKDGAPEVPALRYEFKYVGEEASRAQYQKAIDRFNRLEPRINTLVSAYADPERKRWAKMDVDYLSVKSKIERGQRNLKRLNLDTTPADDLATDLDDIEQLVDADDYGRACKQLATLKPKVDKLESRAAALAEHRLAMGNLEIQLDPARCVARGGQPTAAVKAWRDAENALNAALTLDKADKLAALREALVRAGSALVQAYESGSPSPGDATTQELAYRKFVHSVQTPQWQLIRPLVLYTTPQRTLRTEYGQLANEAARHEQAGEWTEALDKARTMHTKGQELLRAHRQTDKAAKSFQARYAKSQKTINGLIGWLRTLPVLSKEQQAFMDAGREIENEQRKPNADYKLCQKLLSTKLEPALKTLADARRQSLHAEVQNATTPVAAGNLIDSKEPWELELLEPSDQTALLRKLRESWSRNNPPSNDQRAKQRKVYLATKMDDSFLEHEGERRQQLVNAFKGDREMKQVGGNWKDTDWEKRRALLQRVANEQCKAFGFAPPPVIKLVDLGGSKMGVTNGYFDPNTKAIVINVNPASSANDFERAVDLIVHENSHYYQDQLCTGMIDPGKRDKRLDTQVDLFKANDDGEGYVTGAEDFETYQHQPLEEHAHFAGPQTASGILALLNEQEDPPIDLSSITKLG